MARKPARLERAGALTPRDRMWGAMRALGSFSAVEVHYLANLRGGEPVRVESVLGYLEGLSRAEKPYVSIALANRVGGRPRKEVDQYILLRDVGVDAPRVNRDGSPVTQGAACEAMWDAMRALKEFDYADLARIASERRGVKVTPLNAASYVRHLELAGYLVASQRGAHAKTRYRFVKSRNTGPRAPLVTGKKEVIDGNTGNVVYPKEDVCQKPT